MVLQIRGVHHIVMTVTDMDRSTIFYENVLGVKSYRGMQRTRSFPL
jgi:catechol 2,3-dioxygenase-like lactoylglutathione lyase family enzyme